ncbi:HNH endonuclease signature motif containing protein [Tabrizicola sp.]|uniref:HNH endonuclease signature motif containing protein n=1 Tax=Tabrizicola sp. TaxID=2005166 RepID=UPI0035AF8EA7
MTDTTTPLCAHCGTPLHPQKRIARRNWCGPACAAKAQYRVKMGLASDRRQVRTYRPRQNNSYHDAVGIAYQSAFTRFSDHYGFTVIPGGYEAPDDPASVLSTFFDYDPETGQITHRDPGPAWFSDRGYLCRQSKCPDGKPADTSRNGVGYRQVQIFGRPIPAQVVAFAMHHGRLPDDGMTIDHLNWNRGDNRADNLQEVTAAENTRRRRRR